MKKILNLFFSFPLIRALFFNCLFVKANNDYYVFYLGKNGWEHSNRYWKIRQKKMNIQEIYVSSGKQEIQIVRCINNACKSILNMHNGSYTVTNAGKLYINEYNCNCCGQKQWFISDEINSTKYYLNCSPEPGRDSIYDDIFIKNHRFPENESVLIKKAY